MILFRTVVRLRGNDDRGAVYVAYVALGDSLLPFNHILVSGTYNGIQ